MRFRRPAFALLGFGLATLSPLAAGIPVCFQALDPVRPDETLLLFGADVTPRAAAEGVRIADDPVAAPPESRPEAPAPRPVPLKVLQATDLSAKVLIPADWKPGVFAIRLRTDEGASAWQLVNRPCVWGQSSGAYGCPAPGGEVRLFGKNLGPASRVWLADATGKTRELAVSAARDYDVAAKLPADAAPGPGRLWVHNGAGGAAGFSDPLPVRIAAAPRRPAGALNVKTFGARGDDRTDDTAAIRRALAAAARTGGGVVFFPAGAYVVTGKMVIPPDTVLEGAGRDETWIKTPREGDRIPAIFAGAGRFTIRALSFKTRTAQLVIASPDIPVTYGPSGASWNRPEDTGLGGVVLEDLRIRHLVPAPAGDLKARPEAMGPSTIAICGPFSRFERLDVVSSGQPLQHAAARGLVLRDCRLAAGRNAGTFFWGLEDALIEGNEFTAADLTAFSVSVQGATRRVCFRKNRFHDAYGWNAESLTFDTPYAAAWVGRDFRVDGTKLTLGNDYGRAWLRWIPAAGTKAAVIVSGRGLGQAVGITAANGLEVTLAHPFPVPPDETSKLAIISDKREVLVVDNDFSDDAVAVQLYSQTREFIVADNRAVRSGGSYAVALDRTLQMPETFSCSLFNQWIGNTFRDGLAADWIPFHGSVLGYAVGRGAGPEKDVTPAIGNRFVRNSVDRGTRLVASVWEDQPPVPPVPSGRDAIFEGNSIRDQPVGVFLDRGQSFTLVRANFLENVPRPVRNDGHLNKILPQKESVVKKPGQSSQ